MENQNELKLLRPRSLATVVRDGYRLYMGTFRSLFRSSWPVAIVYAVAFALFMGNVVNDVIPLQVSLQAGGVPMPPPAMLLSTATMLFFMLAAALLAAQAVDSFRVHKATGDILRPQRWYGRLCLNAFLRLLAAGVWMVLVGIVIDVAFFAVIAGILSLGVVGSVWKSVASMVLIAVLMLIVVALCVPFLYTVMRALLDDGKIRLTPPFKGYGRGMRHWGLLFATVFVVSVFTGLLTLVCELPAVIMTAANTLAYVGLALGDPLGMPPGIVPLTYGVFFVAGFIQAYVHLSTLYPLYYAYGAIEEMENEGQRMKDATQDNK